MNPSPASSPPPEIVLRLTLADVNLILEGIGALPFARVFDLIGRVQSQTAGQLQAAAPPEARG
jgi:hypothetical protein